MGREKDLVHAQFLGQIGGMQAAGAAERQKQEIPRIIAPLQ